MSEIKVLSRTQRIIVNADRSVSIVNAGPVGPRGLPGTGGASGDTTFVFNQSGPALVWNIPHNLGKFPSVTVVDDAGYTIEPDVQHVNMNNVTIYFGLPTSGNAYMN